MIKKILMEGQRNKRRKRQNYSVHAGHMGKQHLSVHPVSINHFGECLVIGQEECVKAIPRGTAFFVNKNKIGGIVVTCSRF